MHLCCLETISENMLRYLFADFLRNVAGGRGGGGLWSVQDFSCAGWRMRRIRAAAQFSYRSHLNSSVIFISTSCCDEMKRFAYHVHIQVHIVFTSVVIANYGGFDCGNLIQGRVEIFSPPPPGQNAADWWSKSLFFFWSQWSSTLGTDFCWCLLISEHKQVPSIRLCRCR